MPLEMTEPPAREEEPPEIVPMAKLDDIVFGAWDVYPANAFQSAMYAEVLQEKDTKKSTTGAKVFSIFICILAVPITACWVTFDIRIILSMIASSTAFVFRITKFSEYGSYQYAQLMNQIGTCFKVVFLGCLLYFGIKLLILAGKKFIRLNRRLWTRGF